MGVVDGERGASAHAEERMCHLQHVQMCTLSNTDPLFVVFYVFSTGRE